MKFKNGSYRLGNFQNVLQVQYLNDYVYVLYKKDGGAVRLQSLKVSDDEIAVVSDGDFRYCDDIFMSTPALCFELRDEKLILSKDY
jgi:hypothetical protein